LLKALCGGSNTDIDQQDDGRRVNENSDRSANSTESNPARHGGSSATQRQKPADTAQPSVFGGLSVQQIMFGAVALFVALM